MSAEVKSGIAFGIVMVVIGLAAIWIVRWQTYFLLRREAGRDHYGVVLRITRSNPDLEVRSPDHLVTTVVATTPPTLAAMAAEAYSAPLATGRPHTPLTTGHPHTSLATRYPDRPLATGHPHASLATGRPHTPLATVRPEPVMAA